jgi:hypothetical protein
MQLHEGKMNNENSSGLKKDDIPWYVRLITGIIYALFAVSFFSVYYYIIKQLAGLVSSWIEANFYQFLPGCLGFSIDTLSSMALQIFFLLTLPDLNNSDIKRRK